MESKTIFVISREMAEGCVLNMSRSPNMGPIAFEHSREAAEEWVKEFKIIDDRLCVKRDLILAAAGDYAKQPAKAGDMLAINALLLDQSGSLSTPEWNARQTRIDAACIKYDFPLEEWRSPAYPFWSIQYIVREVPHCIKHIDML